MKNKILKTSLIITPILFIVGLVPVFPESFNVPSNLSICPNKSYSNQESYEEYANCVRFYENIGVITLFLSPIVFLISVFLLATGKTKEVLRTWRKVTIIFWVLSLPFLLSSGGGGLDVGIGGGVVLYLLLWIYFFLSLGVITFRTIQLRGRKE